MWIAVDCGLWLVACGWWLVAGGWWLVAGGLWLVAFGLRLASCGDKEGEGARGMRDGKEERVFGLMSG